MLTPPRALALPVVLAVLAGGAAFADKPAPADPLADRCRAEPDSALCREVRRLCATKEVRDETVATCRALGWYGDTLEREIVNLCPLDATHPDCQRVKDACEQDRAADLGNGGPALCAQMGWGEYAYTRPEASRPDDWADDGSGDASPGDFVGGGSGGAGAATGPVMVSAGDGPAVGDHRAGAFGAGARLGLVDDEARVGGSARLYAFHADAASIAFLGSPLAAAGTLDLGAGEDGGFLYRVAALGGLGFWTTPHLGFSVLGGLGLSGMTGDPARLPLSVDLPVRALTIVHLGDRVTASIWGQLEWRLDAPDARQSGSPTLDVADALQLGAVVVVGARTPANARASLRPYVGVLYDEAEGTRIFSIVLGVGAGQEAWNR